MILKKLHRSPLKIAREPTHLYEFQQIKGKKSSTSLALLVGTVLQVSQIVNEGKIIFTDRPQPVSAKEMIAFFNHHAVIQPL